MTKASVATIPRQPAATTRPDPDLADYGQDDDAARGLANAIVLAVPLWGLIGLAVWVLL